MASFANLPLEMIVKIASYLNWRDLIPFLLVNKKLFSLFDSSALNNFLVDVPDDEGVTYLQYKNVNHILLNAYFLAQCKYQHEARLVELENDVMQQARKSGWRKGVTVGLILSSFIALPYPVLTCVLGGASILSKTTLGLGLFGGILGVGSGGRAGQEAYDKKMEDMESAEIELEKEQIRKIEEHIAKSSLHQSPATLFIRNQQLNKHRLDLKAQQDGHVQLAMSS